MWIKNAWYVAAWSEDVTSDAIFARTYLGEPVIMYRTGDGRVTALEDRCCHRHAPLSKGRIEGDDVRCMYHGLKFGPGGQCVEIPGGAKPRDVYRVRHFPVVEKQNLIWIWMGDESSADANDIIDYPYLDSDDWAYQGGYLPYEANYRLAIDNFLDFSHLPYVHENTIGANLSFAEERPVIEHTDYGVHVINKTDDCEPAPTFQKAFAAAGVPFDGKVDRWSISDIHFRGNFLLGDFGTAPVGEGGHEGDRKNARQFRHFSAMTPETENTSHYHFAQTRDFGIGVEGLNEAILKGVLNAFYEDKDIIEAQQRTIDLNRDAPMLPLEVDKALLYFRKTIDGIIAAEQSVAAAAE